MNKRQLQKKKKLDYVKFACKINISEEIKQDSIAHKIKSYFECGTITNKMLFKWDNEKKKVLVSRKHLIYLLSLCNDAETLRNYDMEIVECNNLFKEVK